MIDTPGLIHGRVWYSSQVFLKRVYAAEYPASNAERSTAMQLLFIHGPAASGKLTLATELAALSGMRLFHNHLAVDLVMALFDFGTEPFVRLRESIWLDAFREAALQDQSLIFTFQPEASVRDDFPERAVSTVQSQGGEVIFIELNCEESEIERRIANPGRAEFGKLQSLSEYRRLRDSGAFAYPALPAPALRLDTKNLGPQQAAERIAAHLSDIG